MQRRRSLRRWSRSVSWSRRHAGVLAAPVVVRREDASRSSSRIPTAAGIRGNSAVLDRPRSHDGASSLVGRLARLGCTRIGSPGIFGERNPKALFRAAKAQVAGERKGAGYRASSRARRWPRGPSRALPVLILRPAVEPAIHPSDAGVERGAPPRASLLCPRRSAGLPHVPMSARRYRSAVDVGAVRDAYDPDEDLVIVDRGCARTRERDGGVRSGVQGTSGDRRAAEPADDADTARPGR